MEEVEVVRERPLSGESVSMVSLRAGRGMMRYLEIRNCRTLSNSAKDDFV